MNTCIILVLHIILNCKIWTVCVEYFQQLVAACLQILATLKYCTRIEIFSLFKINIYIMTLLLFNTLLKGNEI